MNSVTEKASCRYVVSVLVKDKVGILRGVSAALADLGGDMDGISQTVLDGYFALILTVTFAGPCSEEALRSAVQDALDDEKADVVIRAYDVPENRPPTVQGSRYLVTLNGKRTVGILKAVTNFLANQGVNVEGWTVYADGPRATHLGEVTVPDLLDIKQVQDGLQEVVAVFGFTCGIQHENIFLVTNKVGAVRPLLRGAQHV
ncbi:MAG: ACT domain-containing protein [Kiritimatiellae bacterium]|nr:ACT domain-containing protein [Kiritimatiellia bacterium]